MATVNSPSSSHHNLFTVFSPLFLGICCIFCTSLLLLDLHKIFRYLLSPTPNLQLKSQTSNLEETEGVGEQSKHQGETA